MQKKLLAILAIAALAPFTLAACGDDEPAADPTPAAPATDTGGADKPATGSSTVRIAADPGGTLAFEQSAVDADAGTVTIEFTNESSTPHDVLVEGPDGDLGGTDTITGDTASAELELDSGDYTFYCSVPGHRDAGMEGALTVK